MDDKKYFSYVIIGKDGHLKEYLATAKDRYDALKLFEAERGQHREYVLHEVDYWYFKNNGGFGVADACF